MRKWGELSQQEKTSKVSIAIIGFIVIFAIFGTIAYLQQPKGYQPEKDTRPVFGRDE